MEVHSSKDSSVASSPFSSPNVGALLKIRVVSWSQETGLPVTVCVRVGDKIFNLHKHQLFSKSGYFKRILSESSDHELPEDFPGGAETFEMLALFLYGSSTMIDPFNVAALRCAAEFLEMTEEHSPRNLCDRFDLYLNQVVLQSWDDTLIVLQKCQALLPWSEELLIVSRCIESLAFMACMEILDPERRRDQPVVTLEALSGLDWSVETRELWIKDLIALPFGFFKRVIGSLRRQGMKERFVSPIVVFYASKWLLSEKTRKFLSTGEEFGPRGDLGTLQGVLELLPTRDKAGRAIPVRFYLALLARSLELGLEGPNRAALDERIASLLYFARVKDLLLPRAGEKPVSRSREVAAMESIISRYVGLNKDSDHRVSTRNSVVAELWDSYVSNLAPDPEMDPERFMELLERLPICYRDNHDQLYRAISTFLQEHPSLSQEQRSLVCKSLNCRKLSQEACIEAVQNDLMPLRLIVQALLVQQLNTHRAFKDCSGSFRLADCADFSGSVSSSRILHPEESPSADPAEAPEFSRKEYESTSFRIQSLEQELMSLKRSLQWQNIRRKSEQPPEKAQGSRGLEKDRSRRSNPAGQATNCIGSVNFSSQRRCANRLLKVIRRITLFGSPKLKRKPGWSGLWSKAM